MPVSVHILEREYQVMCDEGEQEALLAAAQQLNARMREIRSSGRIVGGERIAVMTSLNLIHELMQLRVDRSQAEQTLATRIKGLNTAIDLAMDRLDGAEKQDKPLAPRS